MAQPPHYQGLEDMVPGGILGWANSSNFSQVFPEFPNYRQTEAFTMLGHEDNVWCGCRLLHAHGLQGQEMGPGTTYQCRCCLRVLLNKLLLSCYLVTSPCDFSICAKEEPVATFFTGFLLSAPS